MGIFRIGCDETELNIASIQNNIRKAVKTQTSNLMVTWRHISFDTFCNDSFSTTRRRAESSFDILRSYR